MRAHASRLDSPLRVSCPSGQSLDVGRARASARRSSMCRLVDSTRRRVVDSIWASIVACVAAINYTSRPADCGLTVRVFCLRIFFVLRVVATRDDRRRGIVDEAST